jgi:transcriptional regulator with XRE-family HTH domain
MTRKKQTKKSPRVSQRPFPWRCHECGELAVQLSRVKYEATLRHDGRLHSFTIPELELPVCASCGARVFTDAVDGQISAAYRADAQLLLPQQIRDAIQRVNLPQKEVAKHLRLAEETLSRWLNDSQIQSRSMDTLLRLYFAFPEVRNVLSDESNRSNLGIIDIMWQSRNPIASRSTSHDPRLTPGDSKQREWIGERDKCRPAQKIVQEEGDGKGATEKATEKVTATKFGENDKHGKSSSR